VTLARTAMRLAAINSLQGADTNSGPTIANNRVYDSRITDFSPETFVDDAKPTVIVMTDADEGEQLSRQNGGPPFHRLIDLVFEIGIVQTQKDGTDFVVGYPDTDARHEAALDTLEFQISRRLGYDPDASAVLFRKFVRPQKHECHRQVLDDAGVKIACRILTWTCEVNDDQVIVYNTANGVPVGLASLPEPLRSVAAAMPAGSSGADVCNAIIAALSPPTVGPLTGVDFTISGGDDVSDKFSGSVALNLPTGSNSVLDFTVSVHSGLLAAIGEG
jgi:hypothetical protein